MDDFESHFLEALGHDPADVERLARLLEPHVMKSKAKVRECVSQWDAALKDNVLLDERWALAKWRSRVLEGHGLDWDEAVEIFRDRSEIPPDYAAIAESLRKDYKKFPERTVLTLEEVCALAPEMVVRFQGKPARIHKINTALKVVKVRREDAGLVSVPFGSAGRFIEKLASAGPAPATAPDHQALRDLADSDPRAFLKQVLRRPEEPVSFDDIRAVLKDLLPGADLKAWWDQTADTVPLVRLPSGKITRYRLVEGPEEVEGMARSLTGSRRLGFISANASVFPDLIPAFRLMLDEEIASGDAAEAFRAFKLAGKVDPGHPPSWDLLFKRFPPAQLYAELLGSRDRVGLIPEIADPAALTALLRKEDNPACLGALWAKIGGEDLASELLRKPEAAPAAFIFLMGRVGADEELTGLARHMGPPLLTTCLEVYRSPAFARLIPGLNALWGLKAGAGFLMALIEHPEEARDLLLFLDELQEMQISSAPAAALRTRLLMRFPELKAPEETLWCTEDSLRRKREEFDRITKEEIPRTRTAVKEARELGDLRENFEYKAAREKFAQLQHAVARLDADLKRARPIQIPKDAITSVYVGASVDLESREGERLTLTLLGPWESDPAAEIYSYESDAGKVLLGKEPGGQALLFGKLYTITAIRPWNKPLQV
jgi:transcription elongation GreA/GreB family factor